MPFSIRVLADFLRPCPPELRASDYGSSTIWLQKGVKFGLGGLAYELANDAGRKTIEGKKWLHVAAELGHPTSTMSIARGKYEKGKGSRRDMDEPQRR